MNEVVQLCEACGEQPASATFDGYEWCQRCRREHFDEIEQMEADNERPDYAPDTHGRW